LASLGVDSVPGAVDRVVGPESRVAQSLIEEPLVTVIRNKLLHPSATSSVAAEVPFFVHHEG